MAIKQLPLREAISYICKELWPGKPLTDQVKELARHIGADPNTIVDWMKGRSVPSYRFRRPLQEAARDAGIEIDMSTMLR